MSVAGSSDSDSMHSIFSRVIRIERGAPQPCGPGLPRCSVLGQCCDFTRQKLGLSALGVCVSPEEQDATSEPVCTVPGAQRYAAPPRTACLPPPMIKTTYMSSSKPKYLRCGPRANALCPWNAGGDLCCVAKSDDPEDGRCMRCDLMLPEERGRMLVWDGGVWGG